MRGTDVVLRWGTTLPSAKSAEIRILPRRAQATKPRTEPTKTSGHRLRNELPTTFFIAATYHIHITPSLHTSNLTTTPPTFDPQYTTTTHTHTHTHTHRYLHTATMSAKKATASTTNPPPPPQSDSDDSDATITPSRQLKRSRESPCASPPTTITPEALAQRKIAHPRPRTNPKYTATAVWAQEYREKEAAREAVRAAEAAKAARATQAPPPTPPTSSSPPTSPAAQLAALRRNLDAIRDILTAVSPTSHGAQWAERKLPTPRLRTTS